MTRSRAPHAAEQGGRASVGSGGARAMIGLIDRIDAVLARLETLFLLVANLCLLTMLLANLLNIVIRATVDRSMLWVFPWTSVLFVWCTFIGMFVIYRRGADITVDFVYERVGGLGRTALRVFANLVVIAVLAALLSVAPTVLAAQRGDIELTFLSRWMLSVPLFVSSALIVVDIALDLARAALGLPARPRDHRVMP